MHKPNCQWENFYQSLTFCNPDGPDERLTIREGGIEYEGSIHGAHPDDREYPFNFCPLCGERL